MRKIIQTAGRNALGEFAPEFAHEVLLNALSDRGIYVSSGSACSSNHPALSSTLQAIGLDKKLIEGTLRFSFCENTTKEELDQALKALQELLPMLRRYTRR